MFTKTNGLNQCSIIFSACSMSCNVMRMPDDFCCCLFHYHIVFLFCYFLLLVTHLRPLPCCQFTLAFFLLSSISLVPSVSPFDERTCYEADWKNANEHSFDVIYLYLLIATTGTVGGLPRRSSPRGLLQSPNLSYPNLHR